MPRVDRKNYLSKRFKVETNSLMQVQYKFKIHLHMGFKRSVLRNTEF